MMTLLVQSLTVIGVCFLLCAFIIFQRHILDAYQTSWHTIFSRVFTFLSKRFHFSYTYISYRLKSHQYFNTLDDETLIGEMNETVSLGLFEQSEPHLIRLISRIQDERLPSLYEQLAVCYFHMRQYKKALIILEQALQKFPKQASLYAWYGRTLHAYGKTLEAQKILKHARSLEKNPLVNLIYQEVCGT